MSNQNDLRSSKIENNFDKQSSQLKTNFDPSESEQEYSLTEKLSRNHWDSALSLNEDSQTKNTHTDIAMKEHELNQDNIFDTTEVTNKNHGNGFFNQDHGLTPLKGQKNHNIQQSSNPYNAPKNIDEPHYDVDEEEENTWYHLNGRIGRIRYLAYNMIMMLFSLLLILLAVATWTTASRLVILTLIAIIATPIIFYSNIIYPIRRLHDLNLTGWWCIIGLIPYINVIFYLYIVFAPGSDKMNDYGFKPRINRTIHYTLGLLPIGITIVSILAAIALSFFVK